MADPLTIAMIASAGAGLLGKLFGPKPPAVPDYAAEAVRSGMTRRAETVRDLDRVLERAQDRSAAVGGPVSSGFVEGVVSGSGGALAQLDASIADSVAQAANRTATLRYQQEVARQQASGQSWANIMNAVTQIAIAKSMGGAPSGAPAPDPGFGQEDIARQAILNFQQHSPGGLTDRLGPRRI